MTAKLYLNGDDITYEVLSYKRTQDLCSGLGDLLFSVHGDSANTYIQGSTITVEEDSVLKGTFYVSTINRAVPNYTIEISCQDSTKWLDSFFISDKVVTDTPTTTSRYWISYIFGLVGVVSYSLDFDGDGVNISKDTEFGNNFALDELNKLCMMNGWFMYADNVGVIRIGNIVVEPENPKLSIHDTEILDISLTKDDSMLRNRVVVRGTGSTVTKKWVTAEVKKITPWNYDNLDYRSTCITDSYIPDTSTALVLANQLLKETEKITYVKTVRLAGFYDLRIGEVIYVSSKKYSGICVVTSVDVTVSGTDGNITTLMLDERCPRLFGYIDYGGYVYVGTDGSGIWRKLLKYDHTWTNFSTGLTDLSITNLSIANGVYACTTENGYLYTRTIEDSQWNRFSVDSVLPYSGGMISSSPGLFISASVDRTDGTIYAGYNKHVGETISGIYYVDPEDRSWVAEINPGFGKQYTEVTVSGLDSVQVLDIDSNEDAAYATIVGYRGNSENVDPLGYEIHSRNIASNSYNAGAATINEYGYPNISSYFTASGLKSATVSPNGGVLYWGQYAYYDLTGRVKKNIVTNTQVAQVPYIAVSMWCTFDENTIYAASYNGPKDLFKSDFITQTNTTIPAYTEEIYHEYTGLGLWAVEDKVLVFYSDRNRTPPDYSPPNKSICKIQYYTYTPDTNTIGGPYTILETNCQLNNGVIDRWGGPAIKGGKLYGWVNYIVREASNYGTSASFVVDTLGNSSYTDTGYKASSNSAAFVNATVADFSNDRILALFTNIAGQRCLGVINEDSSISTLSTGVTNGVFISSKNIVYILISNNVYDINYNLLATIPTAYAYSKIARNADDITNGIIYHNETTQNIERLDIYPELHTTTIANVPNAYIHTDDAVSLDGYKIRLAQYLFYTDESIIVGTEESTLNLLEYQNQALKYISEVRGQFVDTSKTYPVTVYGGDKGFNNGTIENYWKDTLSGYMESIFVSSYVSDARTFDYLSEEGISRVGLFGLNYSDPVSGYYLMVTDYDNILTSGLNLGGVGIVGSGLYYTDIWKIHALSGWVTFSGIPEFVETTNYQDQPYFFVSLAGESNRFYQKDEATLTSIPTHFVEHSAGLPASKITIVRTDDSI